MPNERKKTKAYPKEAIIEAFHAAIGEANVQVFSPQLTLVYPNNSLELKACLQLANQYQLALYPISKGRNWGYFNHLEWEESVWVVALERMDLILAFDSQMGIVSVQPGVSFQQLDQFLQAQGTDFIIDGPGSTAQASVVGHALERGLVQGMVGERYRQVVNLEVMLADGTIIHTGMGGFPDAASRLLHDSGLGPDLKGLFFQSAFGIVTAMTLCLKPRPEFTRDLRFTWSSNNTLAHLIDELQDMALRGILQTSCSLYNQYHLIAAKVNYPVATTKGQYPLPADVLAEFREKLGGDEWLGVTAAHGESENQLTANWELLRERIEVHVHRFRHGAINAPSPFFGEVERNNLQVAYWRKSFSPNAESNPVSDQCGMIWCSPVVPLRGENIVEVYEMAAATLQAYQLDPISSIHITGPRYAYFLIALVFDQAVAAQQANAEQCHRELLQKLGAQGYIPYRLNAAASVCLPAMATSNVQLLERIKKELDPNGIFPFSRYAFNHQWIPTE